MAAPATPESTSESFTPTTAPRYSPSSAQALSIALALRDRMSVASVTSEMILFGLAGKSGGAAAAALGLVDSVEAMRQRLANDFNWSSSATTELRGSAPAPDSALTENGRRIVGIARELATQDTVRDRHLFIALLRVPECLAYQWLQRQLPALPLDILRETLERWSPDEEFSTDELRRRLETSRPRTARPAFSDSAATRDRLGFDIHALALAEIILKRETVAPLVVGVYGPWGSGKSTFLRLVELELQRMRAASPKDAPELVPVRYNAWAYNDAGKLWAGLVEKIAQRLDRRLTRWQRIRYAASKHGRALVASPCILSVSAFSLLGVKLAGWLLDKGLHRLVGAGTLGGLFGLGLTYFGLSNVSSLEKSLRRVTRDVDTSDLKSVTAQVHDEMRHMIRRFFLKEKPGVPDQVRAGKAKVVVFIDELDRCPLHRIVDILEAIKLFLAEEIFIVLLAVDTRVAAEAIQLHYEKVHRPELAREYLEKIVQIPLEVPKASGPSIEALLRDLMRLPTGDSAPQPPSERAPQAGARDAAAPTPGQPLARIVSEEAFAPSPAPPQPPIPLELPDSEDELRVLATLGERYLDGNPRRIKRVLNTYRYVKLVCHRRGQPTDRLDWQRRMLSWLVFSLAWPEFMAHAVTAATIEKQTPSAARKGYSGRAPTPDALATDFPLSAEELVSCGDSAGNFLVESSPT